MKNTKNTKRFPYKLTVAKYILAFGAIALFLVGIGISANRIIQFGVHGFNEYLQNPLLILICVFGIAAVVSILVKSEYRIDEQYFYIRFGFIQDKFSVKDVTSLFLDKDTNKLTVYFGENFIILTVNPAYHDEIIKSIREVNPDAEFNFTLTENKPQNEE